MWCCQGRRLPCCLVGYPHVRLGWPTCVRRSVSLTTSVSQVVGEAGDRAGWGAGRCAAVLICVADLAPAAPARHLPARPVRQYAGAAAVLSGDHVVRPRAYRGCGTRPVVACVLVCTHMTGRSGVRKRRARGVAALYVDCALSVLMSPSVCPGSMSPLSGSIFTVI